MSTQGTYPCRVDDGRFVIPCTGLASILDGHSFGKGRALYVSHLINVKTGAPSRSFVVLRMGAHLKKGIVLNCCPICGERIDAPAASTATSTGGDNG